MKREKQSFLNEKEPEPINYQKSFEKPKNSVGRPSNRITLEQFKTMKRIIALDIAKQGKISKAECPMHRKRNLSYTWHNSEGVRIHCEICSWSTHFEPMIFQNIPIDPIETYKKQFEP